MGKKNKAKSSAAVPKASKQELKTSTEPVVQPVQTSESGFLHHLYSGWVPYIIIAAFSFLLYANTLNHSFALDDGIVISKNEHVLKGIAGLKDIFTTDLFDSYYKQMNTIDQLSGGRYRPFSVASFAIEQEFIGTLPTPDSIDNIGDERLQRAAYNNFLNNYIYGGWDRNKNGKADLSEDLNQDGLYNDKDTFQYGMTFRHINNVLFYALTCCIIFLFLSGVVFKQNHLLALIVTLLFVAHPIHTEVVGNVKSRDEIFSLLFMVLTLWFAHQAYEQKSKWGLWLMGVSFLFAMLSKEYGATLLILVPLSLYLFAERKPFSWSQTLKPLGVLFSFFLVYFLMRKNAVNIGKADLQDTELLNNPYLLANETERIATYIFVFLKYILTLIWPHPLCSDYSYNSIVYRNFSNPEVWIGLLSLLAIPIALIYSFRKKNWTAFALAFYFLNILLVTNFIFNVGATMGERLAFHSSLGYCMLLGGILVWLAQKMKKPDMAFYLVIPILILYSVKTIARNPAWKDDFSLALTDVKINPESVLLNGNAATRSIDMSDWVKNKPRQKDLLRQAVAYCRKALSMHTKFTNGYMTIGLAYAKLDQLDSTEIYWQKAFEIYPSHPMKERYYTELANAYYNKSVEHGQKQQWSEGKKILQKVVQFSPNNARYWYDLGGFSLNSGDLVLAKEAWTKAYQLNPNDSLIRSVQGVIK